MSVIIDGVVFRPAALYTGGSIDDATVCHVPIGENVVGMSVHCGKAPANPVMYRRTRLQDERGRTIFASPNGLAALVAGGWEPPILAEDEADYG